MKSFIVLLMMVSGSVCADGWSVPCAWVMSNNVITVYGVMTNRQMYTGTNWNDAMNNYGLTNAVREMAKDGTICRVLGHRWGESNQLGHISFSYDEVRYDGSLIRRCIQLGGYYELIGGCRKMAGMIVELHENGTFKTSGIINLEQRRNEFLACLSAYNIRKRLGILKGKTT